MKLVVLGHDYQNDRYIPNLEALAAHPNVEVTLICPERFKGQHCHWNAESRISRLPIKVRFGRRQGTYLYDPHALGNALDHIRPDLLLHVQEVYALGAAQVAAAAARRSIPLVMFVWENVPRSLAFPRRILRRYVLNRCSAMIAGSTGCRKIHQDWGFLGPIEVIPFFGVNVSAAQPDERRDQDALSVCFIGRLVPYKGVDCLLRAVASLHQQGLSITCSIAGEGPELENLTSLARELGIIDHVRFCGQLSATSVRTLLQHTDVEILPSRHTSKWSEQFGRVLTEAMAEATVTMGSRTGAIPEVIGFEDLLFAEDDWKAIAKLLERLHNDPQWLTGCRRKLWMRAKENYTYDRLAARAIQFLREVAAHPVGSH
jgi:glycosyltransferase involved in cell wall biosynthesis